MNTLSHKTAKRLKEAGFPFTLIQMSNRKPFRDEDGTVYAMPDLSDLIEACGDGFDGLMSQKYVKNSQGKWVAMKDRYTSLDECFFADTPSEAVAMLWLQLNEKKV